MLQLGIETEDENQLTPIRVFEDNEDIWYSNIKSKATSPTSTLTNEDNSQKKMKKENIISKDL